MGMGIANQPLVSVAALLAGTLALSPVFATPPQGRSIQNPVPQTQPQPQPQSFAQHLDLRPPAQGLDFSERAPMSFPSMAHRQPGDPQVRPPVPSLAADGVRSQSTVQDFARRVHREGLPVARLFESNSALIHLGLSPRGKPGLWLVQKTH
jgi:hypothetical protein